MFSIISLVEGLFDLEFDYVVVGAGSAGCVVANRLSANNGATVALIEAGGADNSPWIHIPVGYFRTMGNPKTDWCYKTEADPGLNGRTIDWPRGKVLGGSSSINGLLYVRGQPQDFDHWRQLGNTGWSWSDVLPYFRRAENWEGVAAEERGVGGPLNVSENKVDREIVEAWLEVANLLRKEIILLAEDGCACRETERRLFHIYVPGQPRCNVWRFYGCRRCLAV